jgi:hypothetical protein
MLASAIKRQLMGGNFESFVRQFGGLELVFRIDDPIEYAVTSLADEMLVPPDQRIEMLRAPEDENPQFFICNQFLQIAVNRAETDVGELLAHLVVDLVRGRVRLVALNRIPDNFELSCVSRLCARFRHGYAAKSSAKDFCTSGVKATWTR